MSSPIHEDKMPAPGHLHWWEWPGMVTFLSGALIAILKGIQQLRSSPKPGSGDWEDRLARIEQRQELLEDGLSENSRLVAKQSERIATLADRISGLGGAAGPR